MVWSKSIIVSYVLYCESLGPSSIVQPQGMMSDIEDVAMHKYMDKKINSDATRKARLSYL